MLNLEFNEFDIRSYVLKPEGIEQRFYSGGAQGSSSTSTPQSTPQQLMQTYLQYLPQALSATNAGVNDTTQTQALAAAGSNPIYTASGLQQLAGLAPGYSAAGSGLSEQQLGQTNALLSGQGQDTNAIAAALQAQYNPAQSASNNQASNLVNSINLNGLSGSEQSAVERSLNQSNYATGNLGLDNATTAVSNAMNFGNALQAKRTALGSALGAATGVSGQQNTNFNPVTGTMNLANPANNFGLSQYNPTQANSTLSTPYSFSSSFGNQLAGIGAASKTTSNSSGAQGGCFLTTAACEYKGLPDDCELLQTLRNFRDTVVPPSLVARYYRISPTIAQKVKGDEKQLKYIYDTAKKCESLINAGKNNDAICEYQLMVVNLSRHYV